MPRSAMQSQEYAARLLENGRCFVRNGAMVEQVIERCLEVEVKVEVKNNPRGGWWIILEG